tara:strand:- start:6886 stop:7140 length:255 start_codon:yes stop_codon:yes gene_type:complete
MQRRNKNCKSERFKVSATCRNSQAKLADSFVHVLSVYTVPFDTWYHIPADELGGTPINLYPHIIGSKGTWEKYKGAWEVFDQKL